MELNEKEYLAQTVAILDKKIKDSNAKYKKSREKLRSNIQNQGNNFSMYVENIILLHIIKCAYV